jgi:hypothetical protein
MSTDDYDEEDRPRRPRNSRDDEEDAPVRRRRDDDFEDRGPPRRSNAGAAMGIASLVLGIISIPLCICSWFDLPFSILAIIFGFVSRAQGGPRGTATAGIICGFASLAIVAVIIILYFAGAIDPEKLKQFEKK